MTDYHVVWPVEVRDQVLEFISATLSGSGHETAELNRALAAVEETLRRTPAVAGESRGGQRRVLVALPVAVEYRLDETGREVFVLRVQYSPGKRT